MKILYHKFRYLTETTCNLRTQVKLTDKFKKLSICFVSKFLFAKFSESKRSTIYIFYLKIILFDEAISRDTQKSSG